MSVPPETIRVKRKRGDETTPVSFLQLGDVPKRHCSGGSWAYQRVISGELAALDMRPVIHPSKPGDSHLPAKHPLAHADADSPSQAEQRQRQFYMSRTPFVASPESPVQANKKRRYSAAVFIERDTKKQGISTTQTQGGEGSHTAAAEPGSARQGPPPGTEASQPPAGPDDMDVDSEMAANEPRALKRPGKSSRIKQPTGEKGGAPPTAPAPAPLPQFHGDMDKVAAAMNAWTVDEIQRNLDDLEKREPAPAHPGSRDALRFQPRVPARRYAERHPQQGAPMPAVLGGDTMAVNTHQNSDGEWVEVVYHRVPASKIDGTIPRGDIGVIVFEDEQEKEYFYDTTEGDSDDGFQDEDDENAEDYYGADYPEDEVSSGDEYGLNPYKYRANASGDEEFDDDDEFNTFSGDDDEDGVGVVAGDNDEEALRKIRTFVARHSGR